MSDWTPIPHEHREVMNIRQCSEYLGISSDTMYKYAMERFIPGLKLGNRWRFKKSVVDARMEELEKQTKEKRL